MMNYVKKKLLKDGWVKVFSYGIERRFYRRFVRSKYVKDMDILSCVVEGKTVAYWLSKMSDVIGWATDNYEILKLDNGEVALNLSSDSWQTGWGTNKYRVLKLGGGKVASNLALNACGTGWTTKSKKVLALDRGNVRLFLSKKEELAKTIWWRDLKERDEKIRKTIKIYKS